MPDVAFITLGCKVNQCDTAELAAAFRRRGFRVVAATGPADVYIVNSCAVTARSEAKSRQAARQCARRSPGALTVLFGCYPAVAPGAAAGVAGVGLAVGLPERERLVDLVAGALGLPGGDAAAGEGAEEGAFGPRLAWGGWEGRTRAIVKVQEGCVEFCSYCVVPRARGGLRSRPVDEVVAEVAEVVGRGCREVVLCGTHLGAYGREWAAVRDGAGVRDEAGGGALLLLLRRVSGVAGPARVRLSSVEPMDASEDLIRAVATWPRLCRHLHLPLQSGSDRILALMGRRYTAGGVLRLVELARRLEPDIGLTTDIMVGFPGEGEADFRATLDVARAAGFSRIHVFPYSPRPGTRAERLPGRVPAGVRAARCRGLAALGASLALEFHRRFVGRDVEVLVEGRGRGGAAAGLTTSYVRCVFSGTGAGAGEGAGGLAGRLVNVRVSGASVAGVTGVGGTPGAPGKQGCRY